VGTGKESTGVKVYITMVAGREGHPNVNEYVSFKICFAYIGYVSSTC